MDRKCSQCGADYPPATIAGGMFNPERSDWVRRGLDLVCPNCATEQDRQADGRVHVLDRGPDGSR